MGMDYKNIKTTILEVIEDPLEYYDSKNVTELMERLLFLYIDNHGKLIFTLNIGDYEYSLLEYTPSKKIYAVLENGITTHYEGSDQQEAIQEMFKITIGEFRYFSKGLFS